MFYYQFQPANNYKITRLADANEYEKIYTYFHSDSADYTVRFGIHNRIVIPFFATFMPAKNISTNFFILNTFFAMLSLLALIYLFRYFNINTLYIVLSAIYFSLHWVGPFRQNAISPINVDMPVYLFEVIFLILFIKKKYFLLLILSPVGIATKELFLAMDIVFLFIALFWKFYYQDKSFSIPWILGILFTGVLTKLLLNYYYPSVSPDRNSMLVMAFHLREMALHPDHAIRWILSLFGAFSAFLFVTIKKPKDIKSITKDDALIYLLGLSMLALSILGGMDYTRLIFLGFPYVMISILKIGNPTKQEMIWAFILSITLTRFWMVLPSATGDIRVYGGWMPEYADTAHLVSWTLTALLYLILYFGGRGIWRLAFKAGHTPE